MQVQDSLLSTYYVFNQTLLNYFKAYHHIPLGPEVKQILKLLNSYTTSYDLPGLNVKIPDRSLSRCILYKDSEPVWGELKQNLINTVKPRNNVLQKRRGILRGTGELCDLHE